MRSVSIGPASFHSATWLLSYTWHLISHGSQSMSWRCLLQLHHTDDSKAYLIAYWRYYKPSPVRSAFENSANLDMEKISSDHLKNCFHSRVPISIYLLLSPHITSIANISPANEKRISILHRINSKYTPQPPFPSRSTRSSSSPTPSVSISIHPSISSRRSISPSSSSPPTHVLSPLVLASTPPNRRRNWSPCSKRWEPLQEP